MGYLATRELPSWRHHLHPLKFCFPEYRCISEAHTGNYGITLYKDNGMKIFLVTGWRPVSRCLDCEHKTSHQSTSSTALLLLWWHRHSQTLHKQHLPSGISFLICLLGSRNSWRNMNAYQIPATKSAHPMVVVQVEQGEVLFLLDIKIL